MTVVQVLGSLAIVAFVFAFAAWAWDDLMRVIAFQVGADGSAPRRTLVAAASGDPAEPSRADTLRPYDWDAA